MLTPSRLPASGLALVFSAAASLASAQSGTQLTLHTANGACVAVTDANGLVVEQGGSGMQANGVTLTALSQGACNAGNGGGSSSFGATLVVSGSQTPGTPVTPAVNSPFYVIWQASTDATVCTRGGSFVTGVSGWTPGSTGCTGSACASVHAEQVTPTAAGSYAFSVTCTNASGLSTSAPVAVPQPTTPAPTPNPITLTPSQASIGAGGTFSVDWPQMSGTTKCNGSGTLNGATVANLGDWTSLTTVSTSGPNSRNVTVPASAAAGNLVLKLTCPNADNSASAIGETSAIAVTTNSLACSSVIDPGDGHGQRTRLTQGAINYGVYPTQRQNVDLTEWDNIWGHNTTTDPVTPWPGVGGASPVIKDFPRKGYLAAHFKTPATNFSWRNGGFTNPSLAGGPAVTMTISTKCGDFSATSANLPTAGCFRDNVPTADTALVQWKFSANAPGSYCNLQPNTDYYVNMMFTDPDETTECANTEKCKLASVSAHN